MAFFVVNYTYRTDADLDAERPRHREYLGALAEQGLLRASGPLVDAEAPGGVLIFEVESVARVQELLADDPFKAADCIADTRITQWNPVIGAFAPKQ